MALESVNPTTGKKIKDYPEMTQAEIGEKIEKCHKAFGQWRRVSFKKRGEYLCMVADQLEKNKEKYARLMADEMGKPISQGRAEVDKCSWACRYYAENGENFLKPELVETDAAKSFVTFQPLGVILGIMPWNFPLWQVFRFIAPTLMAGNGIVFKHSSNVSGCAFAIEEVVKKANLPKDLFHTLLVGSKGIAKIIENPLVKAVTLTGSTQAGKMVAANSGASLKKTVLELGGSDPYVVLEDANLEEAANTCVQSRLNNAGQSCIAAKRFIVAESVFDQFQKLIIDHMKSKKMGDPLDPTVEVGPMARDDLRDELHEQVKVSIDKGAKCLLGGKVPEGPGAFYPPTVLADVKPGMPAYEEELFGPVAAVIRAKGEKDAIRIANDSCFGLGAAVFTKDVKRGEKIASEEIDSGNCFVNTLVRSDPRLPFGGVKESGYGRELGVFGIREFVNIKTVYVK